MQMLDPYHLAYVKHSPNISGHMLNNVGLITQNVQQL
jgi:hypothetical protein